MPNNASDLLPFKTAEGEAQYVKHAAAFIRGALARTYTAYTKFLNPREAELHRYALTREGAADFVFWGGRPECERVMLAVCGGDDPPDHAAFPIAAVRVDTGGFATLTHRDYLGAITALGIKREMTGDIVVDGKAATVFLHSEIADYICVNLTKVGSCGVKAAVIAAGELPDEPLAASHREIVRTVASPRLDAIVGEALGWARDKAKALIQGGGVMVDHMPVSDGAFLLTQGARLSIRGAGRFQVVSVAPSGKKGRYRVVLHIAK